MVPRFNKVLKVFIGGLSENITTQKVNKKATAVMQVAL